MELSGRYRIAADRETVWRNLNDPEVLAKVVPGCQSFEEKEGEDGGRIFAAAVKLKVGPVGATFKGEVALEDVQPPASYRLRGEGKGGVAGFGKGFADVALTEIEDGAATILAYAGEAQVGGKLAQIGSRLIGGTVKKLAAQFFEGFAAEIGAAAEELPAEAGEEGGAA
ncbi:MAG: carbon monoxide dehydrogenase subunit G [Pseudomonadota bacterium]